MIVHDDGSFTMSVEEFQEYFRANGGTEAKVYLTFDHLSVMSGVHGPMTRDFGHRVGVCVEHTALTA